MCAGHLDGCPVVCPVEHHVQSPVGLLVVCFVVYPVEHLAGRLGGCPTPLGIMLVVMFDSLFSIFFGILLGILLGIL